MCKWFVLAYRVQGLFTVGRFDYEVVEGKCLCKTRARVFCVCVCVCVSALKYLRNNFEKLISEW